MAVTILFLPAVIGSFRNTFYPPKKSTSVRKPTQKPASQPQNSIQSNSSTWDFENVKKVIHWIFVIIGVIIVFSVIKGFLDWWFSLFGLGMGLLLLLLLFNNEE